MIYDNEGILNQLLLSQMGKAQSIIQDYLDYYWSDYHLYGEHFHMVLICDLKSVPL